MGIKAAGQEIIAHGQCASIEDSNELKVNRVSGGSAPIQSALLKGTKHRSDGQIPPRARLKAGPDRQTQHWTIAQRPFFGNLKASPDARPVDCTVLGFVPRFFAGRELQIWLI